MLKGSNSGGIVKKSVVAIISFFILAGIAAPAQASQGAVKKYSSCADLVKKYPNGVAKDNKARDKAVKGGFAKPKVSKSLYKKNSGRLDRNNGGVMCGQQGTKAVTFKTEFGFVTTQSVKAPMAGQCVNIPATLDVRNVGPLGSFGLTVRLISEFGSVFAYEEISTDERVNLPYKITQPGVLDISLKACGNTHAWTHHSGNRQQTVAGVKTDERIALVFYRWLGDVQLGSDEYFFS